VFLNAGASTDPQGFALSFAWDINDDLRYRDEKGARPRLTWAKMVSLGLTQVGQSYEISVSADDRHGHVSSSETWITVTRAKAAGAIRQPKLPQPGNAVSSSVGQVTASGERVPVQRVPDQFVGALG